MTSDIRTLDEKDKGYPPNPKTMINRCTRMICGGPNEWLFDFITEKLLDYLNSHMTASSLFAEFKDTPGAFAKPFMYSKPSGRWLSGIFNQWLDEDTAAALAIRNYNHYIEVLRVPGVGPDTYYDMFNCTLLRYIRDKGECLCTFLWPDGTMIESEYFEIVPPTGNNIYIKVIDGCPTDIAKTKMEPYVFPKLGEYILRYAYPKNIFSDPKTIYSKSELEVSPQDELHIHIKNDTRVQRIGYATNGLRVFCNSGYTKIGIVKQQNEYSYNFISPLYNKRGNQRSNKHPCKKFAFNKQEDIEEIPKHLVRGICKPTKATSVFFPNILPLNPITDPPGTYKVLGYFKKGKKSKEIVISTVIDITVEKNNITEVGLEHNFDSYKLMEEPPPSAFLQGDIIRQSQRETNACGPYSIAHAASYWAPLAFNPLDLNGKWIAERYGYKLFGLIGDVWTPQGTMQDTARELGFSNTEYILDHKNAALKQLKRWIHAGIPVIVNIDETIDTGGLTGEHYKVLVGYDDNTVLHYIKNDGSTGTRKGAFYFINSGAMGKFEGEPNETHELEGELRPGWRETHEDYQNVPIGNDVDAYEVFWQKFKRGGFPPVTVDNWCMPLFPSVWEKVASKEKKRVD